MSAQWGNRATHSNTGQKRATASMALFAGAIAMSRFFSFSVPCGAAASLLTCDCSLLSSISYCPSASPVLSLTSSLLLSAVDDFSLPAAALLSSPLVCVSWEKVNALGSLLLRPLV